ncbi:MAG: DUF805 domain-containing protein [Thiohalocapsa sp.]
MRGNIIAFDPGANTGAISGFDGRRYDFTAMEWHGAGRPRRGDIVDFVPDAQRATRIYLVETGYVQPGLAELYLSPRGRASRSQYWLWFILPVTVISLALNLLELLDHRVMPVITALWQLAVLWPGIAVLVKRIHDRDKSAWLLLALYGPLFAALLFTGAAFIAGAAGSDVGAWTCGVIAVVLWVATLCVGIWFFVEFGCLRGTIGANRFGPDPVPAR